MNKSVTIEFFNKSEKQRVVRFSIMFSGKKLPSLFFFGKPGHVIPVYRIGVFTDIDFSGIVVHWAEVV